MPTGRAEAPTDPTGPSKGESKAIMVTPRLPKKRFCSWAVRAPCLRRRRSFSGKPAAAPRRRRPPRQPISRASGRTKHAATKAVARDLRKQPVEAVVRNLTLRLTGSLAADDKSEVGSNAVGNVSETRVERGSFVKKGDVLLQIDPRDAQNALDEGLNAAEELRVRLGLDEAKEFSRRRSARGRGGQGRHGPGRALRFTARRPSRSKTRSPWKATTSRLPTIVRPCNATTSPGGWRNSCIAAIGRP